jgi:thioredoxin 1
MSFTAITRRSLLALGLIGLGFSSLVISSQAQAQGVTHQPFTTAAFAKAQAEGKAILVDVTAPWCPTCKAQKPIIDSLTQFQPLDKLTIFAVDFDSQKDVLRTLRASQQSTLIAFKGKAETARSVGDTNAESIAKLLNSAI